MEYSSDDCGAQRYGRGAFSAIQTVIEGEIMSRLRSRLLLAVGVSSLLTSVIGHNDGDVDNGGGWYHQCDNLGGHGRDTTP